MKPDPELLVLEALRATCAQTRRLNPDPDVCSAALKHERVFCAQINRRKAALEQKAKLEAAAEPVGA